jgi:hypothetical protein
MVTWEKLVVVGWGALWNEYHMLVGAELAAAACVDTACVRGLVRGSPALVTSWMSRTRGHTICSTSHWRVLSVHSSIDPSTPSRSTNCATRERERERNKRTSDDPRSAHHHHPPPMPNADQQREREREKREERSNLLRGLSVEVAKLVAGTSLGRRTAGRHAIGANLSAGSNAAQWARQVSAFGRVLLTGGSCRGATQRERKSKKWATTDCRGGAAEG